ncbi:MAG TPA: hypothetical protein VGR22_05725 [Thermomicrobiales bacterium]|nr:hypothetical protein [Thermomicrobiales bacterium]
MRDPSHVRSLTEAEWVALLERNGFRIETVEAFPKRHEFDDWTGRMQVSEADRERLQAMMREVGETIWREFEVAFDPETGRVISWVDTKTLFTART